MLYQLSYSRMGVCLGTPLVGRAGFEPAKAYANGFTDRPLWPLGHLPTPAWSHPGELNPQPPDYKSGALPVELGWQDGG